MKDFTLNAFESLLKAFLDKGYQFYPFEEIMGQPKQGKIAIIRHDVDDKPYNSLATAQIEQRLGIKGTYYFRVVPQSNVPAVIKAIADLGHEIGYHYEDMALCHGDYNAAIAHFEKQLTYFKTFYPVKTICMHGSPLSKWDNKLLWTTFNYRNYGIIGEPYFDIDWKAFDYLTDTGRRWDGEKVSVRDKVQKTNHQQTFHSTMDVIAGIGTLSEKVMITTHPQRWTNDTMAWYKELIGQNIKNSIKRIISK